MQAFLIQALPVLVPAMSGLAAAAVVTTAAGALGDGVSALLLRYWLD